MKGIKKGLAILLVLCTLLSMVVMTGAAAPQSDDVGDAQTMAADSGTFYKIVHLDCGRKYFTKNWIIALINEMAEDGYNQLELAFGNDGLRFLLNDMSFTANGTTYEHNTVVSAVEAGNSAQNTSGDSSWLTQAEMDEIITAADAKGIEIVPLLNLPGHANAILDIFNDQYNASGSNNTFDVTNAEGLEAAMAIFQKYVDYFASKGCKFFNFGADEYANDASGSFSFSRLSSTDYQKFVAFINSLASYIEGKRMTPRAFNDGLYYDKYNSVDIDTNIQCCYWSSGWGGYNVAPARTIADKGHAMINTNGDFYYVLGKTDQFDSGYSYASKFSNTAFMGGAVSNPAGSMFCIWCDYPNAETEQTIAANTRMTLRAMAARMNDQSIDNLSDDVVPGGFNADGSINQTASAPSIQVDGSAVATSGVTMTKNVSKTLTLSNRESATWKSSDETVITITSAARSTEVIGSSVTATAVGNGIATVTATLRDGTALTTTFNVTDADDTITLTAGGTDTRTQSDVNNADNVDRRNLDKSIATVTVTGKDAVAATTTYTQASSVTCNNLISSNQSNWTAVSGYYYTPDGTNYYPVYAKRSNSGVIRKKYTYTWGYSTTSSTSNVTQIGTQSTNDTSATPNITVYTKTEVPPVSASTTITFTGVAPGTTYVTVGDTTYKIVVNYKTETVNAIVDRSTTVSVSGTLDVSELDTGIANVSVSNGIMTVTGIAEGTTSVTVGDTIYTIIVTTEDLSAVTPLTVEYWITNGRPTDSADKNSTTVAAGNAYSEDGVAVTSFVPANTTKETRTLQYWRCRLLNTTLSNSSTSGTEKQTEEAGDDETYNGVAFTKVRYWNRTWAVYTENSEWVSITSNHQLVAYYLEILPVADELVVTAADWGKKGDGSTSGDYLEPSSSCTVSIQVVYEDGTTNPASTTADDLKSRTIAYGYWSTGRGVGTLNLTGLEGYQIWKIEAETGSETYVNSSTWGSFTVNSFTWDNNAMTVYEGDPVDSYVIHNDSHSPSKEGYYANLMWDENYEAILIKVYVKAKPTDDSLKVVYYDEKFNDELYSYNINVTNGVTFTDITPPPGKFTENNARIDVTGCGIENTLGVTQKFQTDLTKVPEAVGKYKSDLYTYTGSVISDDGKTLYLYYTINTEKLSPMFVVDFGLPFQFDLSQVVNENSVDTVQSVSVTEGTRYGTLSYDGATRQFTYTPTKALRGIDVLTINITFAGATAATTTNVGVMPATTVYYEEGFGTFPAGSITGTTTAGNQTAEAAGKKQNVYGYDRAYNAVGDSNGTIAELATGQQGTFTFTGTGVDVYARSMTNSGKVMIYVYDGSGDNMTLKRLVTVDTRQLGNQSANGTAYNVPIVSLSGLSYGEHTIRMLATTTKTDAGKQSWPVYIDGFRVHGTLENQANDVYTADQEDSPVFIELRDEVLRAQNVSTGSSQYANQIAANTLSQVYATAGTTEGAVIVSANAGYTDEQLTDLLDNGPKNEIYLQPNQALTFKVTTNRVVQVGLKALDKATTYAINNGTEQSLNASTDMFYKVLDKASGNETDQTITITNKGEGILSITELKICDDPNATLGELTAEDLIPALVSLGYEVEPVDAEAALNITVQAGDQTVTTQLTATGTAGESHIFTAAEIKAAAEAVLPDDYTLDGVTFEDVTVVCGEQGETSYTAEAVQNPTPDQPTKVLQKLLAVIKNIFERLFRWL